MSKQSIAFLKTQNFLQTYPIILFFQHNNLSVNQWLNLRIQLKNLQVAKTTELGKIEECKTLIEQSSNETDILVLKNTLIENLLIQEKFSNIHKFTSLFQGPCFALGFSNSSQISDILKITKQTTPIFLLGGIYNNQLVNHLDISTILQLDEKVHEVLITNLNQGIQLHNVLLTPIQNSCMQLDQVAQNLLHCLDVLKLKHQGDLYCLYLKIKSQSNRRFPYGYLVTTSLQLLPTLWDFFPKNFRNILDH